MRASRQYERKTFYVASIVFAIICAAFVLLDIFMLIPVSESTPLFFKMHQPLINAVASIAVIEFIFLIAFGLFIYFVTKKYVATREKFASYKALKNYSFGGIVLLLASSMSLGLSIFWTFVCSAMLVECVYLLVLARKYKKLEEEIYIFDVTTKHKALKKPVPNEPIIMPPELVEDDFGEDEVITDELYYGSDEFLRKMQVVVTPVEEEVEPVVEQAPIVEEKPVVVEQPVEEKVETVEQPVEEKVEAVEEQVEETYTEPVIEDTYTEPEDYGFDFDNEQPPVEYVEEDSEPIEEETAKVEEPVVEEIEEVKEEQPIEENTDDEIEYYEPIDYVSEPEQVKEEVIEEVKEEIIEKVEEPTKVEEEKVEETPEQVVEQPKKYVKINPYTTGLRKPIAQIKKEEKELLEKRKLEEEQRRLEEEKIKAEEERKAQELLAVQQAEALKEESVKPIDEIAVALAEDDDDDDFEEIDEVEFEEIETVEEKPQIEYEEEHDVNYKPVIYTDEEEQSEESYSEMVDESFLDGEPVNEDELIMPKKNRPFDLRLRTANEKLKKRYSAVRNELESYGASARNSRSRENYRLNNQICARFTFKGKTLMLNLGLNPDNYDASTYGFTKLEKPGYEEIPMLMPIKSAKNVKSAVELIGYMMKNLGVEKQEGYKEVDYVSQFENTYSEFEAKGYGWMVQHTVKATDVDKYRPVFAERIAVRIPIETEEPKRYIKVCLRLTDINENFSNGAKVDLHALKQKGLAPKNANYLVISANRSLSKQLFITANEISPRAVKMICMTGGQAYILYRKGTLNNNANQ